MTAQERLLEWCERFSEEFEDAMDSGVQEVLRDQQNGGTKTTLDVDLDVDFLFLLRLIREYRIEKLVSPIVERQERHIEIAEARRRAYDERSRLCLRL